jgi:hypothetical protein
VASVPSPGRPARHTPGAPQRPGRLVTCWSGSPSKVLPSGCRHEHQAGDPASAYSSLTPLTFCPRFCSSALFRSGPGTAARGFARPGGSFPLLRFAPWSRVESLGQLGTASRAVPLLVGLLRDVAFDQELGKLPSLCLALEWHRSLLKQLSRERVGDNPNWRKRRLGARAPCARSRSARPRAKIVTIVVHIRDAMRLPLRAGHPILPCHYSR